MASESLMNAAGRASTHPFVDLRAASRAHQRTKIYPEKPFQCARARCRHRCSPRNFARARLSRTEEIKYHIQAEPWHDDFGAQLCFEEELEHMDEVVQYQRFSKHADVFERRTAVQVEDFGAWARRRIGEMRTVKEARLRRRHAPPTVVEASSESLTTTLPTTADDIHAHRLLTDILTVDKYFLRYFRTKKLPPFHAIDGFFWFGEFKWKWHRNASGFWELGYGDACSGCSFADSWMNTGNGSMYYPCSCADFAPDDPAPDEVQRCSLVEWASGELYAILREEAKMSVEGEGDADADWEVLSRAESEGWSVVEMETM